MFMFGVMTICCLVWCCRNKTINTYSNTDIHLATNPSYIPNEEALEEYAYAYVRTNQRHLNIPYHDYEVIASDNDAYQVANWPSEDNQHLVSNEAYVSSANSSSDCEEYVDENLSD